MVCRKEAAGGPARSLQSGMSKSLRFMIFLPGKRGKAGHSFLSAAADSRSKSGDLPEKRRIETSGKSLAARIA